MRFRAAMVAGKSLNPPRRLAVAMLLAESVDLDDDGWKEDTPAERLQVLQAFCDAGREARRVVALDALRRAVTEPADNKPDEDAAVGDMTPIAIGDMTPIARLTFVRAMLQGFAGDERADPKDAIALVAGFLEQFAESFQADEDIDPSVVSPAGRAVYTAMRELCRQAAVAHKALLDAVQEARRNQPRASGGREAAN